MRTFFSLAASACLAAALAGNPTSRVHAQEAAHPPALAASRDRLVADLRSLTDGIGPRLTGTGAIQRALAWAADRFRSAHVDRVWQEPWTFEQPWTRGPIAVRLVRPYAAPLRAFAWGWTPGTRGAAHGPVVFLDARTEAEFRRRFAGRLRGAWVMTFPPADVEDPHIGPRVAAQPQPPPRRTTDEERAYQGRLRALLVEQGVAGIVKDAAKPDGLHNMATTDYPARPYPLPALVLSHENYAQLWRLRQAGVEVELEADISTDFPSPVAQANVLAEVRGTQEPAELVIVAAHLDSWDLATGANDNGAGVAAVLETARILRSGSRPRRTIRFVLFTGEEQGSLGARAYVRDHRSELANIQAVLVLDAGSGRITGVSLEGREDLRPWWRAAFANVPGLGESSILTQGEGDSDQRPFAACGIPAFQFEQADQGYLRLHHSEIDTFDHVDFVGLTEATATLASAASYFANARTRVPHLSERRAGCQ